MADEKSGPPFAVYLVIGTLAVIGAFSIAGFVLSTIAFLFRVAFVLFVVLVVVGLLRAVFRRQTV